MDSCETSNSKPSNWEKLKKDFENGKSIVLFLGTGIDFDAPNDKDYSWDALLNHLLKYAVVRMVPYDNLGNEIAKEMTSSAKKKIEKGEITDISELKDQIECDFQFKRDVKSTIVKQTLGNETYIKLIQDFLYRDMDKEILKKAGGNYINYLNNKKSSNISNCFFSLFSIADMILCNSNVKAVVTQNYDQFLCEAINYLKTNEDYINIKNDKLRKKLIPNTICDWKGQTDFKYEHINIYHVHGFIPRYDEIQAPKDNRIVLSLDEFYEDSRNVYSWQIASQLHFLSQYTCIFCGLSFDDYTNQRLLHYVKGKHHGNLYYITAHDKCDEKGRIKDNIINKFHENNGLTVLYDEQSYKHLYQLLGELSYGE